MNCVVIGASGFIGSHLVDELLRRGHDVKAAGRKLPGLISVDTNKEIKLKLFNVDITDAAKLKELVKGADIVFHLASCSKPKESDLNPYSDIEINLLGSLNILEAAKEENVQKLIFISSGGTVYGMPKYVPIKEEHPTNPISAYGITKLTIEKYIELYRRNYGLNGIILRVANPFGGRQKTKTGQGIIPIFLSRAMNGEKLIVWGDGSVVRDYLYISDLINAIVTASDYEGKENIFNIGSGTAYSINSIIKIIRNTIDKEVRIEYRDSRKFDVPTNILCIEKAKKLMKWEPLISVPEGIEMLYNKFSG